MSYYVALIPRCRGFIKSDIDINHPFQDYESAFKYASTVPSEDYDYSIWVSNGEDFTKLFPED